MDNLDILKIASKKLKSSREKLNISTKEVADDWGLFDRGEIKEGKAADLVLFDINEVGISNEEFVNDFPGEASRYMRYSKGYEKVIVNGAVVYENNEYTDIKSGTIV